MEQFGNRVASTALGDLETVAMMILIVFVSVGTMIALRSVCDLWRAGRHRAVFRKRKTERAHHREALANPVNVLPPTASEIAAVDPMLLDRANRVRQGRSGDETVLAWSATALVAVLVLCPWLFSVDEAWRGFSVLAIPALAFHIPCLFPRHVRPVQILPQSHVSRHCGYPVGYRAVVRFVADAGCTGWLLRVHVACFHSLRGADAT